MKSLKTDERPEARSRFRFSHHSQCRGRASVQPEVLLHEPPRVALDAIAPTVAAAQVLQDIPPLIEPTGRSFAALRTARRRLARHERQRRQQRATHARLRYEGRGQWSCFRALHARSFATVRTHEKSSKDVALSGRCGPSRHRIPTAFTRANGTANSPLPQPRPALPIYLFLLFKIVVVDKGKPVLWTASFFPCGTTTCHACAAVRTCASRLFSKMEQHPRSCSRCGQHHTCAETVPSVVGRADMFDHGE